MYVLYYFSNFYIDYLNDELEDLVIEFELRIFKN